MGSIIIFLAKNFVILLAKFLSGASVRWIDSQPEGCQRIYFANHTSHLDAIVIWAALPEKVREKTKMVAALDYWEGGPIRRFLAKKVFNAILIDREHVSKRNNPIYKMLELMGEDYSIIIFPEGGRSNGDLVRDFKSGMYYLAKKKPELELIPVYLDNMNRILPRGMILPVPMLSRVVFGPPIWIETEENKDAFLVRAREAVLKLKEY
ncbi:MAG: lysophospholipid acyltransferase family protein [Planctomycetia bacterium]|nr:lysophospholipid acyltransferase family protein [Planctomycetia bacterium]